MIPKAERLTKKDIKLFFDKKNSLIKGNILSMRAQRVSGTERRWAVVVSSAVKKSAYHRNTARRRIYAAIQDIKKNIPGGYHIIFFLRLSKKKAPSFDVLKDDMIRTLHICKLFH